jgi:hypothetical protein
VAVAYVLLPRRGVGDVGQGEVVFDQAFGHRITFLWQILFENGIILQDR